MTLITTAAQSADPTMPTLTGSIGGFNGNRARRIDPNDSSPDNGNCRDRMLLARLVEGDLGALADVFHHHGHALMELATSLLGDTTRVDEVVYDAFLDAWEQAQSADMSGTTIYQWLAGRVIRRAGSQSRSSAAMMAGSSVTNVHG